MTFNMNQLTESTRRYMSKTAG